MRDTAKPNEAGCYSRGNSARHARCMARDAEAGSLKHVVLARTVFLGHYACLIPLVRRSSNARSLQLAPIQSDVLAIDPLETLVSGLIHHDGHTGDKHEGRVRKSWRGEDWTYKV